MAQGSDPHSFHSCLCVSTIPIHAQHQLLCTGIEAYVSRLEAIFCFVPALGGNHHSHGSFSSPISLLFFFFSCLRMQYVSQSMYSNLPCESQEGRGHHHSVVPHFPKAPAHADHHVDSFYPWWASITRQCSHTVWSAWHMLMRVSHFILQGKVKRQTDYSLGFIQSCLNGHSDPVSSPGRALPAPEPG